MENTLLRLDSTGCTMCVLVRQMFKMHWYEAWHHEVVNSGCTIAIVTGICSEPVFILYYQHMHTPQLSSCFFMLVALSDKPLI
jgi:hypothetical protein